jgi:hypothetical protein
MSLKNRNKIEYWYDKNHTGALRKIDYVKHIISGDDPREENWNVSFKLIKKNSIEIDFTNKITHHGKKIMTATYKNRRNNLEWSDGNIWFRIRTKPSNFFF